MNDRRLNRVCFPLLLAFNFLFCSSVVLATGPGGAMAAVAELMFSLIAVFLNALLLIAVIILIFRERQTGWLQTTLAIILTIISVVGALSSLCAGGMDGWDRTQLFFTWTTYFIFYTGLFILCLIKFKFRTSLLERFGKRGFRNIIILICIVSVISGPFFQWGINRLVQHVAEPSTQTELKTAELKTELSQH